MPGIQSSEEHLPTSVTESLEDVFETNVPFSDEPPARTLGRLSWLSTRVEAEMGIFLTDSGLGLTPSQIYEIHNAFTELLGDFEDFVYDGIVPEVTDIGDDDSNTHEIHPLEGRVCDATEDLVDFISGQATLGTDQIDLTPTILELGADYRAADLIAAIRTRMLDLAAVQNPKLPKSPIQTPPPVINP